jgi:hypothetical protein
LDLGEKAELDRFSFLGETGPFANVAVVVYRHGELTIKDGVYISTGCMFSMDGGEISHNISESANDRACGGGVYTDDGDSNSGPFAMSGSTVISGNSAASTSRSAYGGEVNSAFTPKRSIQNLWLMCRSLGLCSPLGDV